MGSIAVWLAALLPSLVGRVLAALGLGVVTMTGFMVAWSSLRGYILQNFEGLPTAMMQLAALAGVGEGLGILLGAITAKVAYVAIQSSAKIAGVGS